MTRILIALALLLLAVPVANARTGLIAYSSGNNLYVVPIAGGSPQQLTSAGEDAEPALSHSGQVIAFMRMISGCSYVYRINVDGTNLTQVSPNSAINCVSLPATGHQNPDWSLDDTQIIFTQQVVTSNSPPTQHANIQTMSEVDGSNIQTVVSDGTSEYIQPDISPTNQILFNSNVFNGQPEVGKCQMSNCGGTLVQLTKVTAAGSPRWSRDGNKAVFILADVTLTSGNTDIATENQDGSGLTIITSFTEPGQDPDLPAFDDETGTAARIIFQLANCTGIGNGCSGTGVVAPATIYTMNYNGSNQVNTGLSVDASGGQPRMLQSSITSGSRNSE